MELERQVSRTVELNSLLRTLSNKNVAVMRQTGYADISVSSDITIRIHVAHIFLVFSLVF